MMGTNRQFLFQRSLTQNAQPILELLEKSLFPGQFRGYRRPFREVIQRTDIQDGVFLGKDIVETPLGNTAIKGHLPAFKPRTLAVT
jgi:hypothetical protein